VSAVVAPVSGWCSRRVMWCGSACSAGLWFLGTGSARRVRILGGNGFSPSAAIRRRLRLVDDRRSGIAFSRSHRERERDNSALDADRHEPDQVGRTGARGKGTDDDTRSVRARRMSNDDVRAPFLRAGDREGSRTVLRKLACQIRLHCPTLTVLFWAVLWLFEESNTVQIILMVATLIASVVVHVYEVSHRDG
jgi:hypothetical protein